MAPGLELWVTDLELTVDGSSFPKIQMLQSIVFARFPFLVFTVRVGPLNNFTGRPERY